MCIRDRIESWYNHNRIITISIKIKYKNMYIEKIKSPADLKKLGLKELQVVADETRQAVLNLSLIHI